LEIAKIFLISVGYVNVIKWQLVVNAVAGQQAVIVKPYI